MIVCDCCRKNTPDWFIRLCQTSFELCTKEYALPPEESWYEVCNECVDKELIRLRKFYADQMKLEGK